MTWWTQGDKLKAIQCVAASSDVNELKLSTLRMELTREEDRMRSSAVSQKRSVEEL